MQLRTTKCVLWRVDTGQAGGITLFNQHSLHVVTTAENCHLSERIQSSNCPDGNVILTKALAGGLKY